MKRHLVHTIWILGVLSMLPSMAEASIQVKLEKHGGGLGTSVRLNGSHAAYTSQGGMFSWSSDAPEAEQFLPSSDGFITFCIELTEYIGKKYNIVNMEIAPDPGPPAGMGTIRAELIRELWYRHIAEAVDVSDPATNTKPQGAFQLAIWELVYDGESFDVDSDTANYFGTGSLTTGTSTNGERELAEEWLRSLDGDPSKRASLAALSWDGSQDQLVEVVPEPSTYIVFTGLILCFGLAGWWRRRKQAA